MGIGLLKYGYCPLKYGSKGEYIALELLVYSKEPIYYLTKNKRRDRDVVKGGTVMSSGEGRGGQKLRKGVGERGRGR